MRKPRSVLVLLVALALGAAACGGDDTTGADGTTTTSTAAATTTTVGGDAATTTTTAAAQTTTTAAMPDEPPPDEPPPDDDANSAAATEPSDQSKPDPLPWTFAGTGTRTLTASTNFGTNDSTTDSSTADVVIVLNDDGTATGTFTFHRHLVFDCTQEEGRHGNVYAGDREEMVVWEGTHTWESDLNAGSFTLLPGSTAELAGSYNAATISGVQHQQYTIPARDECDGTRESRRDLEFQDIPRRR